MWDFVRIELSQPSASPLRLAAAALTGENLDHGARFRVRPLSEAYRLPLRGRRRAAKSSTCVQHVEVEGGPSPKAIQASSTQSRSLGGQSLSKRADDRPDIRTNLGRLTPLCASLLHVQQQAQPRCPKALKHFRRHFMK
jgi:hypothetical protein